MCIWRKNILGEGNNQCKHSDAEESLKLQRKTIIDKSDQENIILVSSS